MATAQVSVGFFRWFSFCCHHPQLHMQVQGCDGGKPASNPSQANLEHLYAR